MFGIFIKHHYFQGAIAPNDEMMKNPKYQGDIITFETIQAAQVFLETSEFLPPLVKTAECEYREDRKCYEHGQYGDTSYHIRKIKD